ncbi:MAG: PQQ-dependent sugar dehydrogenase [Sphingomonadaceae bacterium]|nr:PQQ-dependent sugar dehydrogenase [Sphingomonadaceae bacterium]
MTIFKHTSFVLILSPLALATASCGHAASGDSPPAPAASEAPFTVTEETSYDEPWAIAVEPGTGRIFVTEKGGTIRNYQPASGVEGIVSGAPKVDYGGQGGLGDIAFAPDYETSRMIYLSWAEAGPGNTRGAAVGRGTLSCGGENDEVCRIEGLTVIWRQSPKVSGRGHYSHRIAFSPDGQYLFIASGERQKMDPAQDLSGNLGKVVRLNLDGTPAAGNPMAEQGGIAAQIWSWGHRNILGLAFDAEGKLWEVEHGPRGGDELNLVKPGSNYGWPIVSNGVHYNGDPIPDHETRPEFTPPAISWTPVIAPGDMAFYNADLFPEWQGDLLIAGLGSSALVRVEFDGETAREAARYNMDARIRDVAVGIEGTIFVIEDGEGGRLLQLYPAVSE